MKRIMDIVASFIGLLVFSPILLVFIFLIYWQDKHSPFYIAPRIGINGIPFKMVKLRSMLINADSSGVDSTSATDSRITSIGHLIRTYKLDELTQLWNVLIGDMSLVGPRPNVAADTSLYTKEEEKLLSIKPGITDFSSIIFSDEGEILSDKTDPDLSYNQLIRPWKSRLGLIYINNQTFILDVKIIMYTLIAIFSRNTSINFVVKKMQQLTAPEELINVCKRKGELIPHPPPGMKDIVTSR